MASVSNDTGKIEEVELTDLGNMHKFRSFSITNLSLTGKYSDFCDKSMRKLLFFLMDSCGRYKEEDRRLYILHNQKAVRGDAINRVPSQTSS